MTKVLSYRRNILVIMVMTMKQKLGGRATSPSSRLRESLNILTLMMVNISKRQPKKMINLAEYY